MNVTFFDTTHITENDRRTAEEAYRAAILELVPSETILEKMQADDKAALDAGVDHFEQTKSAWAELDRIGSRAAEAAIGFWPGDAAHFEVVF